MCFKLFLTLLCNFIAIWVHGGHDVYASVVDKLRDLMVSAIVTAQVLDQI